MKRLFTLRPTTDCQQCGSTITSGKFYCSCERESVRGFKWLWYKVGWELRKVVAAFTDSPNEVKLILKKRPRHVTFAGFQKRKPQPRKELPKLNVGPKLRRSYGRRSRKTALNSSLEDIVASQSSLARFSCFYNYINLHSPNAGN